MIIQDDYASEHKLNPTHATKYCLLEPYWHEMEHSPAKWKCSQDNVTIVVQKVLATVTG